MTGSFNQQKQMEFQSARDNHPSIYTWQLQAASSDMNISDGW